MSLATLPGTSAQSSSFEAGLVLPGLLLDPGCCVACFSLLPVLKLPFAWRALLRASGMQRLYFSS